jgi:hypothetical protein
MTSEKVEMAVHSCGAMPLTEEVPRKCFIGIEASLSRLCAKRFRLDNLVADDFKGCDICMGKPWGIYCPTKVPS